MVSCSNENARTDLILIFSQNSCERGSSMAEAMCTTVVPIPPLIHKTVWPISGVICKTVARIAIPTGIGYQHDRSTRFSNKLTYAFNC